MIAIHPEYVVDEKQQRKSVLLPYNEWAKILEQLEELEDIKNYDQIKESPDEIIPFEQAVKEIKKGKVR